MLVVVNSASTDRLWNVENDIEENWSEVFTQKSEVANAVLIIHGFWNAVQACRQ